jgi:crotonobetainyl-CoA:carnitine CoA-transferase CaiB-like acyl-CoA transferase
MEKQPMITQQKAESHDDLRKVTDNILRDAGLTIGDSGGKVTFDGKEPVRKTVIKAGATASCVIAANAVADAAIWKERTGEGQDIHVDLRKAWIEQSPWQKDAFSCTLVNGVSKAWNSNVFVLNPMFARARDGRWMVLSSIYPSQERKAMNLLRSGPDIEQVAQQLHGANLLNWKRPRRSPRSRFRSSAQRRSGIPPSKGGFMPRRR